MPLNLELRERGARTRARARGSSPRDERCRCASAVVVAGSRVARPRAPVLLQRAEQPAGGALHHLARVVGAHRGDGVAEHDPALEQAHALRVVADRALVQRALGRHVAAAVDARREELLRAALAQLREVVHGEHQLGAREAARAVEVVPVEHRHGRGVPVVHVDDVRLVALAAHEFERGAAEVQVRLRRAVPAAVDLAAAEEVVVRAEQEHGDALHHGAEDGRLKRLPAHSAVVRPADVEREVHHLHRRAWQLRLVDRLVVRQVHLRVVAAVQARARQPRHHVAQAAHLGDGRQLSGNVHDVQLPRVALAVPGTPRRRAAARRTLPEPFTGLRPRDRLWRGKHRVRVHRRGWRSSLGSLQRLRGRRARRRPGRVQRGQHAQGECHRAHLGDIGPFHKGR